LHWLQDPSEISGENLNNVRYEASRHFRNKMREYLKNRISELTRNIKNKNLRYLYIGIRKRNELKNGNQCKINLLREENIDLLADSYSNLNRPKNCFSQSLNLQIVSDARQIGILTYIHTYIQ
jgi:hypothetical protein